MSMVVSLLTARWSGSGWRWRSITLRFGRGVDVDHVGEAWVSQRSSKSATVPAGAVHGLGRPPLPTRRRVDTEVDAQLPAVGAALPE